ncbi:hypothetical protein MON38_18745 [Hymenobacter sp. DH14]|uniref:Uncharacterized protein n=1 Tax=Hymenobacter cyanobacteriorum TaxID=2926463 RepID=A0A9X1VIX4_9BACT|nr:hypothetical protein [Hymenobacter cyanobacteriorum]MCI1189465.1 hypothetical protein [Hymenobacter cyanobacteriorum]
MRNPFLSDGLLLALLLLSFSSFARIPYRNPRPAATAGATTPATTRPADYPLTPAPHYATGGHPGTYRLPDGSWHPAEIFGPDMADRVRLRPENLTDYAVFWPGEVSAYVVRGDTFVTVPAFVQRKGHRLVPASFARRQYRDNQYEVLLVQAPTPEVLRTFNTPVVPNGPVVTAAGLESMPKPVANPSDAYATSFFGFLMDMFVFPRAYQTTLLRHAGQVEALPTQPGAYRRRMLQLLADDPALCARLRAGELNARFEAPQLLAAYAADRREAILQARK